MEDKQHVSLEVPFREKISRLFIFRFFWVYILAFPMIPLFVWIYIVIILHFLYMLIMGKRHKGLWENMVRFYKFMVSWQTYLMLLVDERPKFWW